MADNKEKEYERMTAEIRAIGMALIEDIVSRDKGFKSWLPQEYEIEGWVVNRDDYVDCYKSRARVKGWVVKVMGEWGVDGFKVDKLVAMHKTGVNEFDHAKIYIVGFGVKFRVVGDEIYVERDGKIVKGDKQLIN